MPEEPVTFGRCCFAPPKKDPAARRETELKKLKTMKTLKTGLAEDAYRSSSADTSLATPRAKAAVKYEHKVRLHKVGSELFGKYNLGIVCGEHGVGHICVQEVSGRYARELVAGSPLIRVRLFAPEERDVHPASAAQANELIATHECVELVVGVSMQMLAKQLQDVARKLEPELTRELSKLAAERGGTLKGLDHRLKTVESLLRKIAADTEEENRALLDALAVEETTDADRAALADGVDTAAIAYTVKDALRYTVVFPTKVYTESVYKLKEKLKTLGYDAYQEKNYWGVGDNYQGINDVFISRGEARHRGRRPLQVRGADAHARELRIEDGARPPAVREVPRRARPREEAAALGGVAHRRRRRPRPGGRALDPAPHVVPAARRGQAVRGAAPLPRAVHRAPRDQGDGRLVRRPPGDGVRRRRADGVGETRRR